MMNDDGRFCFWLLLLVRLASNCEFFCLILMANKKRALLFAVANNNRLCV